MNQNNEDEFPKYLMRVNGERRFLTFRNAYIALNSGFDHVTFGRYVLNEDDSVRKMTGEDRSKISNAADKYSASK